MRDLEYVRSQPVGVRHIGDGLVVPAPSEQSRRVFRHLLVAGAQDICYPYWLKERIDEETGEIHKPRSEFRLAICGREVVKDRVQVYRHDSAVGYSGLMRCGNVWGCVICATKVLRRRGDQIAALFDAVHADGGTAVMVTFTASHKAGDDLGELLGKLKLALRELGKMRAFIDLLGDRSGQVTATEVTFSERAGWHPHSHQAWFWPKGQMPDSEDLASRLFPYWQKACEKVGLNTLEHFKGRRVGVDVRRAWDASEYLTKWGRERDWSLSAEVTSGRMKLAHGGSVTPWGLLEDAIIRGNQSPAADLWIKYLRGTKGFQCVSLRGARKLLIHYELPTSYDDWKDANDAGEGEVVGSVGAETFSKVVKAGGLGRLLEGARAGGLAGLDAELQSFISYREDLHHGLT